MKDFKEISNKINEYIEEKKEKRGQFQKLEETLKKRTQARYINEVYKENQNSSIKKEKAKKTHLNKIKKSNQNLKNKIQSYSIIPKSLKREKASKIFPKKIFRSLNIFSIKERIKFPVFLKKKKSTGKSFKIKVFAGAFSIIMIILSFLYILDNMTAYKVFFNGEEIGIVKDPESVLYLTDLLDEKLDIAYDADIIINEDNLKFEQIRSLKLEITPDDELLNHFTYFSNLEAKSYSVLINGEEVALFSRKEEAEKFLEEIKNTYIQEDDETIEYGKIYFLENVAIEEKETGLSTLSDFDSSLKYVLKGTKEEKSYKVKKGENYWTIAEKYNITPEELEAANPTVNPERIQIGQEISLIVPKPLVTVVSLEKKKYYERIPYEVTYENTGALFKGENEIKLRGKYGEKEILAEITRQNGIETSRKELESKVIEEPRTQVVLVGTKALPPLIGTGTFDEPARGRLTSRFGIRWGRMHSGIDIAAATGTTIRAADGGVVTYTGWKGNYGLTVIIDHGQNKSTLYAHCSKILVNKGDKVYKGKKIAEIGSTGRSTGPHVHFEVQVNGKAQNPLNYVNY